MNIYTFYWRDGSRDVIRGKTPEEAMNNYGYGFGALPALDFYAEGDNKEYVWIVGEREWVKATDETD
jgi:hypothetical protein